MVDALVASCSVPGILPPVSRGGLMLCDGALAEESGVAHAVRLGADVAYLLPAGASCALTMAPRHPLAAALHAVTLLLQQRAILEARVYAPTIELRVVPTLCPQSVSSADFTQAAALIERARTTAGEWLDVTPAGDVDPAAILSLHHH